MVKRRYETTLRALLRRFPVVTVVSLAVVIVAAVSTLGCAIAGMTRVSFPSAVDQDRVFPNFR